MTSVSKKSSILLTYLRTLIKRYLSYILTYVLSANDRHKLVKNHLSYLHTCRPIKFMLFHTSHLFPCPTQVNTVRPSRHIYHHCRHNSTDSLSSTSTKQNANLRSMSVSKNHHILTYLLTLTYCEQSTQVGKKSSFYLLT